MVSIQLLLNLGDPLDLCGAALYGLEVNDGSLVEVFEVTLVPVGLGAAKGLLASSLADLHAIVGDHGDIILKIL